MASSSLDYATVPVDIRYSHGDGSSQTLKVTISVINSLTGDDAQTFQDALNIIKHKTIILVEFFKISNLRSQYYFEYSSKEYNKECQDSGTLGEVGSEFGISLEITSRCATKMRIRTTDSDIAVPLHFDWAIHPLDAKAIQIYVINALNHGTHPGTACLHGSVLMVLSRFGRTNETDKQPFSLTMQADLQQEKEAEQWVQKFKDAPEIPSSYKAQITGTVRAFAAGHLQAAEPNPFDLEAIKEHFITSFDQDRNLRSVGQELSLLLALSRFGRTNETLEQPFSLKMLGDPAQPEAAGDWVQKFQAAPDTPPTWVDRAVSTITAFRTGRASARGKINPIDREAIQAFIISALKRGVKLTTLKHHVDGLLALSRFGRKEETPHYPFSLEMLADSEPPEAADDWVQRFKDAPDVAGSHKQQLANTMRAFRSSDVQGEKDGEPDIEEIQIFVISVLNQGTSPANVVDWAIVLQALSRFGRTNETPQRPFSLKMLRVPEQREAADGWVKSFQDAPDTASSYAVRVTAAVDTYREESLRAARGKIDPIDREAVKVFILNALNHGTNPRTACDHALTLLALSYFGRKEETLEQPFSLPMLAGAEKDEDDGWVEIFRERTSKSHQRNIRGAMRAFRLGYVRGPMKTNPSDLKAINAYVISALQQDVNPSTVSCYATALIALSDFGRKKETPNQPFSIPMLYESAQKEAADQWEKTFRDDPDIALTNKRNIKSAVNAFRREYGQYEVQPNLKMLPIR